MSPELRKALNMYGPNHPHTQRLLKGRGKDLKPRKRRGSKPKIEVKPHPKPVEDKSPEEIKEIQDRFQSAAERSKKKESKPKPKKGKLLGSSGSLEDAKKLIGQFYHSKHIELHPHEDGTHKVHNKNGHVEGVHVREHKGRYRFESHD